MYAARYSFSWMLFYRRENASLGSLRRDNLSRIQYHRRSPANWFVWPHLQRLGCRYVKVCLLSILLRHAIHFFDYMYPITVARLDVCMGGLNWVHALWLIAVVCDRSFGAIYCSWSSLFRRLHTLIGHRAEISNALFSFDGALYISGSMVRFELSRTS